METLQTQIAALKNGRTLAQLKAEDKKAYYKVQSLSEKLSAEKAIQNQNFVTKEHLVELKNLIIWKINRSMFFSSKENLCKIMKAILADVEANKLVYRTEKGIKSIVMNAIVGYAQDVCFDELVEREGKEILSNSNLRQNPNGLYAKFQSYYLDLKMSM